MKKELPEEKQSLWKTIDIWSLPGRLRFWNLSALGKWIVGLSFLLIAFALIWPFVQWLLSMSLVEVIYAASVLILGKIVHLIPLPEYSVWIIGAVLSILFIWLLWRKSYHYLKRFSNWLNPSDDYHAKAISRYVKIVASKPKGRERVQAVIKPYAERYRKQQQAKVERTNAWDISPIWFSTAVRTTLLIVVMALGSFMLTDPVFQRDFFQLRVCAILKIDTDTCQSAKDQTPTQTASGSIDIASHPIYAAKLLELRTQSVVLVLSALAALVLWIYRDLNKRREQETEHREKLFSEHKQLIEWAAQAPMKQEEFSNERQTADSNSTYQTGKAEKPVLQAAAIYQLAPFIRDRNTSLYQRATLETLRALSNADMPEKTAWLSQ